ncbi:PhzF family phenazine biosynthesis protein [Leifsonia sp. NPDC058248]|uniref:PhzF family phenazine biosynthesis protein n=1 Tax=Leifsonia sp. NPDC058248 TaxID=3346402 RepID=UPI0036D78A72
MAETIDVVVVRVFTDDRGANGNELGIIRSSAATAQREQEIATGLGFSETVFVDQIDPDAPGGRVASIRIFTPGRELPFAGHPSVGTAWWLAHEHLPVVTLHEEAGDVAVSDDGNLTWITAEASWTPAFEWLPLRSPADVDALDSLAFGSGQHYAYAWIDEEGGALRARMFAPALGIVEDEATGAAAVALTAKLGRDVQISQGEGSELFTVLEAGGRVRVGGRTIYDRTISVSL